LDASAGADAAGGKFNPGQGRMKLSIASTMSTLPP
jgi:hypothetical protein